jgi:hypothetical protein
VSTPRLVIELLLLARWGFLLGKRCSKATINQRCFYSNRVVSAGSQEEVAAKKAKGALREACNTLHQSTRITKRFEADSWMGRLAGIRLQVEMGEGLAGSSAPTHVTNNPTLYEDMGDLVQAGVLPCFGNHDKQRQWRQRRRNSPCSS